MRVLSAGFIDNTPAPMINLHPALLPAYKGLDTHQRVIQAGERQHGCSIHVVTAELDAGAVLTQACLEVHQKDTAGGLQTRVQKRASAVTLDNFVISQRCIVVEQRAIIKSATLLYADATFEAIFKRLKQWQQAKKIALISNYQPKKPSHSICE